MIANAINDNTTTKSTKSYNNNNNNGNSKYDFRYNLETRETLLQEIDILGHFALRSLFFVDISSAISVLKELCHTAVFNIKNKHLMNPSWFKLTQKETQSYDFVTLSATYLSQIQSRRIFLEWKILRHYQILFQSPSINSISNFIFLCSRQIGVTASEYDDMFALKMVVKYFNTYLRLLLNAGNIRATYHALFQYRLLIETVISHCSPSTSNSSISTTTSTYPLSSSSSTHSFLSSSTKEKWEFIVQMSLFLRYYCNLYASRNITFLVEVVSHDLASICTSAFLVNNTTSNIYHNKLLNIFLTIPMRNLNGVRKAQIKLATQYFKTNNDVGKESMMKIIKDMKSETSERIDILNVEAMGVVEEEFWEVNDRFQNFDYLSKSQRDGAISIHQLVKNEIENDLNASSPSSIAKSISLTTAILTNTTNTINTTNTTTTATFSSVLSVVIPEHTTVGRYYYYTLIIIK